MVLRQMRAAVFLLLPQSPSSRQTSTMPPGNIVYRNTSVTLQIKQFRLGMFSEYEMIQLFNMDYFMVLIRLSVLGNAF